MKVSIPWLKEFVDLNCSPKELVDLLPLRSIGTKEVTEDFIELDMKGYNRADLLSMRGVAYEVAAATNSKVTFSEPEEANFAWNAKDLPSTPVEVENQDLNKIQCVAKIEGLSFGKSSDEWIKKLENSGMRPVNNIVDVTNLIMLEYGQPLHSFDATTVEEDVIITRRAKTGEEIITLDGKVRKLTTEDIVLADTKKALDVAGVMGGKDTEVRESTTSILLSVSLFNPTMVRKTSQRLGLTSEASKRFYHGLTKKRLLQALNAAIKIYEGLGGRLTAINIVGDVEEEPRLVKLSLNKLNSLVGVEFTKEQVEDYLKKLYFKPIQDKDDTWEVPYWRLDIEIEEDLIEEVARMYGYGKIPPKELEGKIPEQKEEPVFTLITNLKNALVEQGLTEVQTYSFYSTNVLNNFDLDKSQLVKIANPISKETEYLREDLWPSLIEVAARNLKSRKEVTIFELNKTYHKGEKEPTETYRLSLLLSDNPDTDMSELYQIFEAVCQKLKLDIQLVKREALDYDKKFFHPNRFAAFNFQGREVGGIAEVHKRFTDKFGIKGRVTVLEIELDSLV